MVTSKEKSIVTAQNNITNISNHTDTKRNNTHHQGNSRRQRVSDKVCLNKKWWKLPETWGEKKKYRYLRPKGPEVG